MGNLTLIIGMSIILVMLVYMFFKFGDIKDTSEDGDGDGGGNSHFLLQIIILVFIFGLFLLIGKVAIDDRDNCAWNIVNSTATGTITEFDYEYQCSSNVNNTSTTFFVSLTWFIRFVAFYILVYVLWISGQWFLKAINKRMHQ